MKTDRFLASDVKKILQLDENRCYMCQECLKAREQLISYKYPKHLGSQYQQNCQEVQEHQGWRAEQFNLDKEKAQLRKDLLLKKNRKH